ncbi:MAG: methionyl-tRNA formyltransferase [Nitrospinae bacterium RIFCSPLOWO2_02_FULL_39_110]|nr:MAG: methionyl-tRNA formyltransferase [Nitrospinae bacterium RIFCSPHIGHO2_02_39_11]OGV99676.1 MAG: methionyl-tRNA formyltransferase [Nitrospinae bacterium RIFCSPHIGHO2_12_FULL_39_42]OGW01886.1 MAG: methionyl-tRNA formyltransferase [Nitrospinae bacterium RIFCSPHIGHO2_02_FULL_39_82]OGW06394.1 MAG: methionyl-tRNA formyltransferase [Nitrospinae bacterium RIFCSPLOWO2_02_FULL_39_110]OGW07153.1 MAG: methionyl-tRNA formyltransferase [Nitrospinae bacterium RIFCSPLOWO2_02_39_17]OGW10662.1 MAG: methio
MNVIFMGTPDFAVSTLEGLIKSNHKIIAVVTRPDRPKGRGREILPSPVKVVAEANKIDVLQPEKVKEPDFVKKLREYIADCIVVVAFGQILPNEILSFPRYGCINLHASILPKYRGAAPINWALIKGEIKTGVTSMLMNEEMDTGDMLIQREVEIKEDDNAGTLYDMLSRIGSDVVLETLECLEKGEIKRVKQDASIATYAPKLKKEDCLIDWSIGAKKIVNKIRGLTPAPGAYTSYNGKRLKITNAEYLIKEVKAEKGEVFEVNRNGIKVICGDGLVIIKNLQPEGKRVMGVGEFISGHNIKAGEILG